MYEEISVPSSVIKSIDINPNLVAVAVILTLIVFIILVFFYIPRTTELSKLRKDNVKLKKLLNISCNDLSVEINKSIQSTDEVSKEMKNLVCRAEQASSRAEQLSKAFDEYRKKEDNLEWASQ